jgi:hypothetical protein
MTIPYNLYCNGQIAANEKFLRNFDQINWGAKIIERDDFGIPISFGRRQSSQTDNDERRDSNAS